MAKYLILSENPAHAQLLQAHLAELAITRVAVRRMGPAPNGAGVAEEFEGVSDWLEAEMAEESDGWAPPAVTVLTDLGGYGADAAEWSSPLRGGGWAQVLGLLVLAFPEIHWVFLPTTRQRPENAEDWAQLSRLHVIDQPSDLAGMVGLRKAGFSPLFDPAGLRNFIRRQLRNGPGGTPDSQVLGIPLREEQAAAVDDEAGYSFLHAYAAYRFGYRTHVVTTAELLRRLFASDSPFRMSLVFEDIFLNFPDEHPVEFSHLAHRAGTGLCPKLEDVPRRIFVSIGLGSVHRDSNKAFVAAARHAGKPYRIIHKPMAGVFNLWSEAGLVRRGRRRAEQTGRGFVWPPAESVHPAGTQAPTHSAPGRLLRVAERLLRRAERMRDEIKSPMAAVYGAVLALDALELLADRTPTTGIHALTLKHYFEVKAECQFSGVQHHIIVEPRLEEIAREAKAISRWFDRGQRNSAALNAQMQIVNTLIGVFREYNQFDEEQECLARTRRLHHSLWIRQEPWRICLLPVLRYAELLLSRITNFFWAVAGWAVAFMGIFYLLSRIRGHRVEAAAGQGPDVFAQAMGSLLGQELLGPPNLLWQLTTIAAVLVGIAHFGLLTAHLYSLTARK